MQKSIGLFLISVVCIFTILVAGCTNSGSNPVALTTPATTTVAVVVSTPQIIATPNFQISLNESATSQLTPDPSVSSTVVSQSENSKTI